MKFENKGKWFMESNEQINTDDLLAEDELNLAEEDIDDDSEGIFNKEADKKPEQKNERHLFKKGDRVNARGNTGTIASVYYEDPAETRKRFKVLMDKNKKVEVFTEPELRFVESSQKNESWSDLYSVVSEIGTDWEFYKKKPKYTRNELKQATITKLKAKGKSFNSQDLEEALNRWYASESAQMNESRNWKVVVELSSPDNMNNADVEDAVEYYLDKPAGFNVFDVTATRKQVIDEF